MKPDPITRLREQHARASAAADRLMREAKEKFSVAALSCLRGDLTAERQVHDALAEVDRARAALAKLDDDGR